MKPNSRATGLRQHQHPMGAPLPLEPLVGNLPVTGFIAAAGEFHHGQQWSPLATDGLYRS